MIGERIKKIAPWTFINIVRLFKLTELYQPTYNVNNYFFINSGVKKRGSNDRVMAIQNNIDLSKVNTYLDIGSQLGYFVFELAEKNDFTIAQGYELNKVSCAYSNALVYLNDMENLSFTNCKVTPQFAKNMQDFDMISFLNVFHHMVYFDGFDAADQVMRTLYSKVNSHFVFETGQFDEEGFYWSKSLSFMGDDPISWLSNYLIDIGYKTVTMVDKYPTHLSAKTRAFFVCSK